MIHISSNLLLDLLDSYCFAKTTDKFIASKPDIETGFLENIVF